ncbi:hypothetical protein GCM10027271_56800 [Saccharopolyspora gloriosae]|uniref:Uncharacterized protein n=1 Tax=Saccharopolyspora gloriosae TaxID=455344 RepID=A0A840N804_9PSEU|nr:hypothetical protein [Saccharopolyspora gloriosae]MBB5067764.1 hypothetical protein [Saccharopolyspora gloriosae]
MTRALLAAAGLAMIGWGGWYLAAELLADEAIRWSVLGWLAAGPVLTDLVLLPLAGLVGWTAARVLPRSWRAPAAVGMVLSAVLALLAVPFLWRTYAPNQNPGLLDRDYSTGLLIALAVVWGAVLLTALTTAIAARVRRR